MKAVVMAGGEGSRLRPLTSGRPKPMVPVMGRPIMEHIIRLLQRQGYDEIFATLYYKADEISGAFGDGSDLGVRLTYSIEESPLGTAGAVKLLESSLRDDTFVIVSGDALTDVRLDRAVRFHRSVGAVATLVLARVPNPLEFGIVVTDDDNRVTRFLEKPDWGRVFTDTVNTGMYILDPEVFDEIEAGKPYDWSQDVFPKLLEEGRPIYGYVLDEDEYWCDIGTLEQYREAHEHVFAGRVMLPSEARETFTGSGVWVEEGTNIHPEASVVAPAYIGRQCVIKRNAQVGPFTVLGDNTIIEEKAHVERSVIWESCYVGNDAHVTSAVLCSHVTVKCDCVVRENAVVGDGCVLGQSSTVRPGIKIWPDKFIEPGAVVTMSLVWGKKWQGSLFRNMGVSGITNIEITPEFAAKLAASYGAYLGRGTQVLMSRDSHRASRAIKHAVMSGLLSVGCKVLDLRSMPIPIVRHHIRASGSVGGLNVRVAPMNPRMTLMEFLDKNGVYISKPAERKVESIFFREDFARTDAEEVGEIEFSARAIEQYQHDFFRNMSSFGSREVRYKVVVDFAYHRMATIFPSILGKMNCDVIALNAYADPDRSPKNAAERAAHVENLQTIVQTLRADMGVLFESDGERMTLVGADGRVFNQQDLALLYASIVSRSHRRARVAAPVTMSRQLEAVVAAHGGTVIRTRSDIRSLMATAAQSDGSIYLAADGDGGFILPQFQPTFDALYAFTKMLDLLTRLNLTINDVAAEVSPVHVVRETVHCPWEAKGKVMRILTEDLTRDRKADLTDGIRVDEDGGWVLLLPDSFEPMFVVLAEHQYPEEAHRLATDYAERIRMLRD